MAKQASITVKLVKEAEAKDNEELAEEIKRELDTSVIPWAEEVVKVEVK